MSTKKTLRGLWALLSDEQKAKALAYDGPINFGDERFRRRTQEEIGMGIRLTGIKPVDPDLPTVGADDGFNIEGARD